MGFSNYDLRMIQGQSFTLELDYLDDASNPIELDSSFYAKMSIRRSPATTKLVLNADSARYPQGITGGDETHPQFGGDLDFQGRTGTGGILLNYGGISGAVRVEVDHETMSFVPAGVHFYDITIYNESTNYRDKLVSGIVEVQPEVTR